jgi:hypothetical protein
MKADPDYRTPLSRLRRFTGSDIELRLEPAPEIETGRLSELVTQWIGARFGGDRAAAQSAAKRSVAQALGVEDRAHWSANERHAFDTLAPLVAQIPGIEPGRRRTSEAWCCCLRAKGADEFRFHDRLRRHRRLRAALCLLGSDASSG